MSDKPLPIAKVGFAAVVTSYLVLNIARGEYDNILDPAFEGAIGYIGGGVIGEVVDRVVGGLSNMFDDL